MLRVGFADAERSYADALCLALRSTTDLLGAGSATTTAGALQLTESGRLDVLAIGSRLRDDDGLACVESLRKRDLSCSVLLVTSLASADLWSRAAKAGCQGIVAKQSALVEVLDAIRAVGRGETIPLIDLREPRIALSNRQRQVLELMGQGCDPATIAERLFISIHTARGHVKTVMRQMGASTQLEAVTNALRLGYLAAPPVQPIPHRGHQNPETTHMG
ncbi:MAG: response regulator transcription factor [Acidimicrobiales bacterium]|nr:response regulator transcription factor [Acidimicrobiales bacterium]